MEDLHFVESEILFLFIIQSWRTDYVSSSWSYISYENDSLIYSYIPFIYREGPTFILPCMYYPPYLNTVLLQQDGFQPHVNLWYILHSPPVAMGFMSIIRREYHLVITVTFVWSERG